MAIVIHDVLIVGAGPAGLAIAARLREPTPSSIFTDAEHDRYQWIKKHSGRMILHSRARRSQSSKRSSTLSTSSDRQVDWKPLFFPRSAEPKDPPMTFFGRNNSATISSGQKREIDILVLDSSGRDWLSGWKQNFAALEISHLRSPMFFHPSPHDRDGLLAYAYETGRYGDCIEIANCVQKSMSKHRRKKKVAKGQVVGSIEVIGGMPCLTDDLAWADNVPLYIAGRLAGLRIGPDCGNLEGARVGAERISWAVNERLERQQKKDSEDEYRLQQIYQRIGSVNMYDSLELHGP